MEKTKKKKKWWIVIVVLIVFAAIGGAGGSGEASSDETTTEAPTTKETQVAEVTTEAPKETATEAEIKPVFTMHSDDAIGATRHTVVGGDTEPSGQYEVVCVKGHGCLNINDEELFVFANDEYKGTEYSGLVYEEKMVIALNGNDELLARAYNSSDFKIEFYLSAEESLETVDEVTTEQETTTESTLTLGQKNALSSAESYLLFMAFSYEGLIGQLEFEGYTHEEAVFAADNCGADWNQQALKSAKSYLDFSAFSYQGLINQLEFEKYTTEQATYAADNCGADWNEQAAKQAASYLELMSFSKEGLIDQLKFEGFTDEQAAYGVQAVGY